TVPVKKAAKPVTKKAAPKKVTTPVKKSNPKTAIKATKPAPKNQKTVAKNTKPVVKSPEPKKAQIKIETKELPKAKDIKVPPPKPVVLPKITATKARKYEPEFTKSVLDQAPKEDNGPTMRYSD